MILAEQLRNLATSQKALQQNIEAISNRLVGTIGNNVSSRNRERIQYVLQGILRNMSYEKAIERKSLDYTTFRRDLTQREYETVINQVIKECSKMGVYICVTAHSYSRWQMTRLPSQLHGSVLHKCIPKYVTSITFHLWWDKVLR